MADRKIVVDRQQQQQTMVQCQPNNESLSHMDKGLPVDPPSPRCICDGTARLIPQRSLDRPRTVATRRGGVSRPCVGRALARLSVYSVQPVKKKNGQPILRVIMSISPWTRDDCCYLQVIGTRQSVSTDALSVPKIRFFELLNDLKMNTVHARGLSLQIKTNTNPSISTSKP